MNKHIVMLLVVIAVAAAIAAPVIATGRGAGEHTAKCNMFMKFDKKTKTCKKR